MGREQEFALNQKFDAVRNLASRFTLDSLAAAWRGLAPHHKQSFGVLMLVNLAVFGYGLIHHPVGDHDLIFFDGYPPEIAYWSGRWFQVVLSFMSFNTTAPVYVQLLTIFFQVLAAMGMVLLWKPEAGARELILGGLVICLMPLVNWQHYYRSTSHFFSFPQLGMVLALILGAGRTFNWKKAVAAGLLVMISLATYNPSVQTYAVGWAGLLVLRLSRWDGTVLDLSLILKSLVPAALIGVAGGLLYYLTALGLIHRGLMDPASYLNATRSLADMPTVLPKILEVAFGHLRYSQQFLPDALKSLLLCTIYLGLFGLMRQSWFAGRFRLPRLAAVLAGVVFLIFCSKLAFVITLHTDYYTGRVAQMSLPYVHLFFVLTALNPEGRLLRELTSYFLILAVLPYMAVCDLRAQETLVLMARHDFAVANRVMSKMESRLGTGLSGGQYTFVQLGSWKSLNDYPSQTRLEPHRYLTVVRLDGEPVFRRLSAAFEPKSYHTVSSVTLFTPTPAPDVVRAAQLAAGRKPFPDDDFIGVYDDLVVLFFDEEARRDVLHLDSAAKARAILEAR